jgi:hypothetical protein
MVLASGKTGTARTTRSAVMIRVEEVRKGASQLQFSLAALESARVQPKAVAVRLDRNVAFSNVQLNLTGAQLLAGFASAFSFVTLLVWAILKLWLSE